MKTLISNTTFGNLIERQHLDGEFSAGVAYEYRRNYDIFLLQPLTLSMFIPVSETGEVLSEPNIRDHEHGQDSFAFRALEQQYNAAKEKVLFEGVRTRTDMYGSTKRMFVDIGNLGAIRIYERFDFHAGNSTQQFLPSINEMTVEELIPLQIELTPTALKQIFG